MSGNPELATHILVAALLAIKLIAIVLGMRQRHRLRQQLADDPGRRSRFYRMVVTRAWLTAAIVPIVAFTSDNLSPADLGFAMPNGDGIDYLLASYALFVVVFGGLRARRRMRRGYTPRGAAIRALIIPHTTHERRLAVVVSITAGITEEMVYRGLFIAVGTQLYHLPLAAVAVTSLALFVAAHAYQGKLRMVGASVTGGLLTSIYLISGSLLLPIVLHICQDLVALLLIPAYPTVARTADSAGPEPVVNRRQ